MSQWGAFFIAGVLSLFSVAIKPALALECSTERIDERVVVSKIVDGDTLHLKDGRRVRLIGINTPELGRNGKPAEPLAKKARQMLESLLAKSSHNAGLRYGTERMDRYGRTLAHVYLNDGSSVEAQLLSAGLAAQIVVPPNNWNRQCYRAAEREARQVQKGVWDSFYRPMPVNEVPRKIRSFRIIKGRVVRVGESKRSIWLNFPRRPGEKRREGVAVRISRDDLDRFNTWNPKKLKGKQVVVRGWFYPYKKQLVTRLRHPMALELMSE